jgi:hypothetical protein
VPYDFNFGSLTAKGGFASEHIIADKFSNWKKDMEAKKWLKILGYDLNFIKKVDAIQIPPRLSHSLAKQLGLEKEEDKEFKKADIQIQVTIFLNKGIIKRENISIKKANKGTNYNQVDKRKVDTYQRIWGFDNEIAEILKLFTGEIEPAKNPQILKKYCNVDIANLEDYRRIYLNYLKQNYLSKVFGFFKNKKIQILMDIIKGRGALCAEWFMAVKYEPSSDTTTWALININEAIEIFSKGEVGLTKTKRASLKLSNTIIMQRKGGTPDPTSLQFKIKPLIIFNKSKNM